MFITIVSNEALINTGQVHSKNIRYQGFTVILRGMCHVIDHMISVLSHVIIVLYFVDDLCGKVEMGGEYTVFGVPVNKTQLTNGHIIVHTTIEVWISD